MNLPGSGTYYWSVRAIDGAFGGSPFTSEMIAGTAAVGDEPVSLSHALGGASPNPFSRTTTISFSQPVSGRVSLLVYDLAGRRLRALANEELPAGASRDRGTGQTMEGSRSGRGST